MHGPLPDAPFRDAGSRRRRRPQQDGRAAFQLSGPCGARGGERRQHSRRPGGGAQNGGQMDRGLRRRRGNSRPCRRDQGKGRRIAAGQRRAGSPQHDAERACARPSDRRGHRGAAPDRRRQGRPSRAVRHPRLPQSAHPGARRDPGARRGRRRRVGESGGGLRFARALCRVARAGRGPLRRRPRRSRRPAFGRGGRRRRPRRKGVGPPVEGRRRSPRRLPGRSGPSQGLSRREGGGACASRHRSRTRRGAPRHASPSLSVASGSAGLRP